MRTTAELEPDEIHRRRIVTDDGIGLHVEITGSGPDILFLHEFSGDHRSWAGQVDELSRSHRCIVFSARGFPPSDVPADVASYSQARAVRDAVDVLDAVGSQKAHVVGLSMGAFTALNLAIEVPERIVSVVAGSCGYGADGAREVFVAEMDAMAEMIRRDGCRHLADLTGDSPYRLALASRSPSAFASWRAALAEHDAIGQANTIQGVQRDRPTLPALVSALEGSTLPLLFVAGDEDDPVIEANLAAKRALSHAGFALLERTSHTVNLEAPHEFNQVVVRFHQKVLSSAWGVRDPRSQPASGGWVR